MSHALPRRLTLIAPAKVNLWLAILGRREDGYHELDTGMCALALADRLTLERTASGAIELELSGPEARADVPRDARNLAWRAAEAALAGARATGLAGPDTGLHLALEKHVPSQAGLGGGSSDAAAAHLGVEALLGVDAGAERRGQALARLGSDCAFFALAERGLARCTGRGERIEPIDLAPPDWWILVLTPEEGLSTAAVYAALAEARPRTRSRPNDPESIPREPVLRARARLSNDLELAAARAWPAWRAWRELLEAAGAAHFRLAGSGSSFFGLYEEEQSARRAQEALLRAAAIRDLRLRGAWITRPCGHGIRLL